MSGVGHLEAVFIAADDVGALASALGVGLGCSPRGSVDGQAQVPCAEAFVAVEPATGGVPRGSVTLWWRVADASAAAAGLLARGWEEVPEQTEHPGEHGETTAAVRSAEGLTLGFISG